MENGSSKQPPDSWKVCSPELLNSGVDCATAPRWSSGATNQHYHPPAGIHTLKAYQVGHFDIVAAASPEGAIAVLCEHTGADLDEYTTDEVELVDDARLDALEVYDEAEGKLEQMKTSLRQDLAKLTEPSYMVGWE